MSLRVAIQMDPLDGIDCQHDSSFALAQEAQRRGFLLWHFLPQDVSLNGAEATASAAPLHLNGREESASFGWSLGAHESQPLDSFDVILLRQDPPFDLAYLANTHILTRTRALVVNDPSAVRDAPEKILDPALVPLMPETLISARCDAIAAFYRKHRDIVLKPLYGNGGQGIVRLPPGDENLDALVPFMIDQLQTPIVAQRYLPEICAGDKRVIMIDGQVAGLITRLPAPGALRANLSAGGHAEVGELSAAERNVCAITGDVLRRQGILFAGIDLIGGYLTEVNVTSPTGLQEIRALTGSDLSGAIWDAILTRYHKSKT